MGKDRIIIWRVDASPLFSVHGMNRRSKKGEAVYTAYKYESMTKREEYEKKTEDLILPLLDKHNFELVDVEYVKEGSNWFLRAYIDKEGGITVDDCEIISRTLSDLLDKHDYIPDSYILEVSSPGLGRQLKKERDFERSLQEEVEIKLYKAVEKQKEFTGILTAFDKETITIELEDGSTKVFQRNDIAMVRLALDF